MTGDELDRAIAFLLESQANLTAKLDRLEVTVERLSENQESHSKIHERLEATIERLADNHDRLEATVERLAEEAAADRTEVRSAVNTMLSFAEAMAENVRRLTDSQIDTNRRVRAVEDRLDVIENN